MSNEVEGVFKLLHPRLQQALVKLGYRRPTPIQEKAIPRLLLGVNAVLVAPTGAGKTEAALLPVISRLLTEGIPRHGIKVLYVTPLRSLNRDVFFRMCRLADMVGLRMFVRHGDSTSLERKLFLTEPFDIVVMTPETLEYLLSSSSKFREMLREVRAIIIDELHELLDDKRGSELMIVLERVSSISKHRIQRIGLSATIGDPQLAARFLAGGRYVEVIEDPTPKKVVINVELVEPTTDDELLAQALGVEPQTVARIRRIHELVEKYGHVIVFTNTRDTSELLGKLLSEYSGSSAWFRVHHGSLSREERLEAETQFRRGALKALIATSSLELGIDIGHVNFVIQYMSPRQALKLIQRVGRSGHRLTRISQGVILVSRNFYDILESIVLAARAMRGNIESLTPYTNPLDVLVHEIAGIVDERGSVKLNEVYELVTRSYSFKDLDWNLFMDVVKLAEYARIVRLDGDVLKPGRRLKTYHYNITMIPDVKQYTVIDIGGMKKIGVLDEAFVATLKPGTCFVLAGRVWKVEAIEVDRVLVSQAKTDTIVLPSWVGDLIPVEWKAAREAGAIVRRLLLGDNRVYREYPGCRKAWEYLEQVLKEHVSKGYVVPTDKVMVVEVWRNIIAFLWFFGTKLGKSFEMLISELVRQFLGYPPESGSNAYIVVLRLNTMPSREFVETLIDSLRRLNRDEVVKLVEDAAKRSNLFYWKLYHVAMRMGLIEKGAKPERRLLEQLADTLAGREALNELLHDKLDLETLLEVLELLRKDVVRVEVVYGREELSPLAREAIGMATSGDRLRTYTLPSSVLAEVMKRRLDKREVTLICMLCGETIKAKIGELPEKPKCEHCGSRFLALVHPSEVSEAKRVLNEFKRRRRLSNEDRQLFNRLREVADLILTYGKHAIYALATKGVGPKTAKRVLSQLAYGEEAFFKALVEAELKFLKTRQYWRN